jgi:hypothetical protein
MALWLSGKSNASFSTSVMVAIGTSILRCGFGARLKSPNVPS